MLDSDPAVNLIYKGKYTLILRYVVRYRLTDLFDRFIKNNQLKALFVCKSHQIWHQILCSLLRAMGEDNAIKSVACCIVKFSFTFDMSEIFHTGKAAHLNTVNKKSTVWNVQMVKKLKKWHYINSGFDSQLARHKKSGCSL